MGLPRLLEVLAVRLLDLAGQRFGELVALERGDTRKRVTYGTCRCDCGKTVDVDYGGLRYGKRTSCGHVDPQLAAGRRPWPNDPRILVGADGTIVGPMGRLLNPWSERGYLRVGVYGSGRRPRQPAVHIIVCETFHGPRPEGQEVRHLDGNPGNCTASNLRWGTAVENQADKRIHGTHVEGEDVYCAKLTEEDVRAIRAASDRGESRTSIARRYPVSLSTVSRVVLRKTWKHV